MVEIVLSEPLERSWGRRRHGSCCNCRRWKRPPRHPRRSIYQLSKSTLVLGRKSDSSCSFDWLAKLIWPHNSSNFLRTITQRIGEKLSTKEPFRYFLFSRSFEHTGMTWSTEPHLLAVTPSYGMRGRSPSISTSPIGLPAGSLKRPRTTTPGTSNRGVSTTPPFSSTNFRVSVTSDTPI